MRRSTVVYLLLFLVMAGAYYYLNNRPKTADIALTLTPAETPVAYLFNSSDGSPTSIHLESQDGQVVELALNAEKTWAVTLPISASADQGAVEAAVSQLTTIQITDRLPNINPKDVGLDAPAYKLTVKFTNNVERIIEIGVTTPTGNGYYISSDNQVVIVSKSAIDALVGLLTNPPYAQTLTPSPIPTTTGTATETPLPSSTPEPATATNETATPKP